MFLNFLFGNSQKGFGLNFSDYSIEAVALEDKGGEKYNLVAWSRETLPPGIIENGEIIKEDELILQIKNLLEKTQSGIFEGKNVVLSIPEDKTYTVELSFSALLKQAEIKDLIPNEISKIIPFEYKDIYWDFSIVDKDDANVVVSVTACPKKIVNSYADLAIKLKLAPVVIGLESLAVVHGLKQSMLLDPVLVLDMGALHTLSFVYDKHAIRKNYSFPSGGNILSEKIANMTSQTLEDAELQKREEGLKGDSEVASILKQELDKTISRLKKLLVEYESEYGVSVSKLIVTGGGSLLPGVNDYFAEKMNLKVVSGDIQGLENTPKKDWEALFTAAYGLARRSAMPAFGKNNGFDFLRYSEELGNKKN